MVRKLRLQDLPVRRNHRAFVRLDLNVPLTEDGKIVDDTRIQEALPTIRELIVREAKIVLASHLGRPEGKVVPGLSLAPVAKRISEFLGRHVLLAKDCVGTEVLSQVNSLKGGDVLLLENLRFHPEEEANDLGFARELADLADFFVNDAFGAAHRAHASTVGITTFLQPAVAGFLMQKELDVFGKIVTNPERPFYALLGGAKVSDKIEAIKALLEIADGVLIGGAMAYTFLVEKGWHIGASRYEPEMLPTARTILKMTSGTSKFVEIPEDHRVAECFGPDTDSWNTLNPDIPAKWIGMDIGSKTVENYKNVLKGGKTIFWNGPLGVYEFEKFAVGTNAVAEALGESNATVVVGGGDVVAAIHKAGVASKMAHISTGGGAALEFIELSAKGKELPGVAVLTNE